MTPADLLDRLAGVRKTRDGYQACCPAHEDREPSLSVTVTDDRLLVHCHAGCGLDDVLGAVGVARADLFLGPPRRRDDAVVAAYDYRDENGKLLFQVVRLEGKRFRQRRPARDGWEWGLNGTRRVIYRLPEVLAAVAEGVSVWVCEGEKDVHALERAGAVATTCPMGAGKWRAEWNSVFRDAIVAVVADDDEPGRKHARQVARQLAGVAKSVELVKPKVGKDVSDHLAAWLGLEDLEPLGPDEGPGRPAGALTPPWRRASDVAAEKVGWLWFPRIALGKLTLIAGDPGVGKGFVAAAIAASVTTLGDVPDGGCLTRGTVLWASFEDGAGDTLRPRLENQGADLKQVLFLDQWRDENGRARSMSPADVPDLDRWLDHVPDAAMLVIDPVGSFVGGGLDSNRDNEVRSILQPLVDLAARHRVAVLVVAHLNKAELMKALYRVAGSIGFVGLARSVLVAGRDEESGRRGVAHGKNNLGPEAATIEYRIVAPGRWDEIARLEWVGVAADLPKERLLGPAQKKPGPEPEEREAVTAALKVLLAEGPKPAADCLAYCRAEMFSAKTVERAKKELGVICEQVKGPTGKAGSPGWTWRLP